MTATKERVRRLNPTEIESYDVLPPELAIRVRVIRIPGLPGSYEGITLGPLVFLTKTVPGDGGSPLLAHELVHVGQWARRGIVRFSAAYLGDFVRGLVATRNWHQAYRGIEAERDARNQTDQWRHRRADQPPRQP